MDKSVFMMLSSRHLGLNTTLKDSRQSEQAELHCSGLLSAAAWSLSRHPDPALMGPREIWLVYTGNQAPSQACPLPHHRSLNEKKKKKHKTDEFIYRNYRFLPNIQKSESKYFTQHFFKQLINK